jgi:hypothetical protein
MGKGEGELSVSARDSMWEIKDYVTSKDVPCEEVRCFLSFFCVPAVGS